MQEKTNNNRQQACW